MDLTQLLTDQILALNDLVWQPLAMPLVLVIVGGLLTIVTGFVQVRRFPLAVRTVMKGVFSKNTGHGTITPFRFPPDSPNLHMLLAVGSPEQKARYMEPYAQGEMQSAIAISEPGAGADPAAMATRAVRAGDEWVINGRKIWVSSVPALDFTILMAVTDPALGSRGGITAFIVDRDTPGFTVERAIPILGGTTTYELVIDDMAFY